MFSAPNLRFLKAYRLLRAAQYQVVIKEGYRSTDSFFTVYAQSNHLTNARIGITVSRRVSQRAVERNRIKRTMRESFRHNQACLGGLDVVAIARTAAEMTNNRQLITSLKHHWQKVNHQCKNL